MIGEALTFLAIGALDPIGLLFMIPLASMQVVKSDRRREHLIVQP
jgi:hypothetical protein